VNINTYVSSDEVLADVLVMCKDEGLKNGVTKGWYYDRIKDALDELGFDTFFLKLTTNILNWVTDHEPKNERSIWMPENIFNLREIYLVGGTCCEFDPKVRVHYKSEFNNSNVVTGKYSASRNESLNNDEFYGQDSFVTLPTVSGSVSAAVTFAAVQNGLLMINDGGTTYPHLRLIHNGISSGNIKTEKIIPTFFKRAVSDYTTEKFFRQKMTKEARAYKSAWDIAVRSLQESWLKAERRVKKLDSWERKSLTEYLSRANE